MNIVICDDFESDREFLKKHIAKYCLNNRLNFNIFCFSSGDALLDSFEQNEYNIIFLDIYMEGKNGIETANAIRNLDSKCSIIFTTTSPDHAIESFEVQALHYLLKPLSFDSVEKAMDRCKQFFAFANRYIEVMSERIIIRVLLKDLIFAEVYSNVTIIHTVSGEIKTYMSLDKLTMLLDKEEFLRCHRSYIVNMSFILELENCSFILQNGQKIPIRRQDKNLMKQRYAEYLFTNIRRKHSDF